MSFEGLNIDDLVRLSAESADPIAISPITADDLRGFNTKDAGHVAKMSRLLDILGIDDSSESLNTVSKFLERWEYTPGTPAYDRAFADLTSAAGSKRVMLGMARRAGERAELLSLTGGNMQQNCVRVAEGPDPCPACLELNGEEGPVAMFASQRMMPGDQCYGGDNCMCILVPIDNV